MLRNHAHILTTAQVAAPIGAAANQSPSALESPSADLPNPEPLRLNVPAASRLPTLSPIIKADLPGFALLLRHPRRPPALHQYF